MIVYQCENSLEGVLTAIYQAYEEKCDHADTRISLEEEAFLFAEYRPVVTDAEKARKVTRTLLRRFGEEDYQQLCLCLTSSDARRGQAVYQTVVKGLALRCGKGHLFDQLADADVHLAFSLARNAGRELHHLMGFLRFQELEEGILYARFCPKNDLLPFLMPHFADRFPLENFLVLDEQRNLFGVHPAGKDWFLLRNEQLAAGEENFRTSARELRMEELFRYFCKTIAIGERRNPKLQQNMLPLRFREYMVEFALYKSSE